LLRVNVGQPLTIDFSDGKDLKLIGKAVPLPDAIVQAKKLLGISIEPLTPMLAEKYHLTSEDGLLVVAVDKDSVGGRAGLETGDVIVRLGRYRISKLDDFASLVHELPEAGRVEVGVVRGDRLLRGILEF